MKRRAPLRSRGRRAEREAEAAQKFALAVLRRPHCERCRIINPWGMRRFERKFHPHHLVSRARGAGWKYLHNPDVNGSKLCMRCHREVHDHVGCWKPWILTLPEGEARAKEMGYE